MSPIHHALGVISIAFATAVSAKAQTPYYQPAPTPTYSQSHNSFSAPTYKNKIPENVIAIKDGDNLRELLKGENRVVILLGSLQCEPCEYIKKNIINIAEDNPDITFVTHDKSVKNDYIDELVKERGVTMWPSLHFLQRRVFQFIPLGRLDGYQPIENIQDKLDEVYEKPERRRPLQNLLNLTR